MGVELGVCTMHYLVSRAESPVILDANERFISGWSGGGAPTFA